jgi:hypothetical protein
MILISKDAAWTPQGCYPCLVTKWACRYLTSLDHLCGHQKSLQPTFLVKKRHTKSKSFFFKKSNCAFCSWFFKKGPFILMKMNAQQTCTLLISIKRLWCTRCEKLCKNAGGNWQTVHEFYDPAAIVQDWEMASNHLYRFCIAVTMNK